MCLPATKPGLFSAAETVLISEGDKKLKKDLLNDLRRATLGYVSVDYFASQRLQSALIF